ncbi:isoprenylcysteine carboxyl methyltransferase family protein [Jeotgalibacillus soli]|uniref:Isoprenylcysteine carboxyl methyltransferase n=1 Tax=Jeotgalibacillus soli TaxID=889306 RepID=A0A0C2VLM3_9BACL|nr:isoprenylcysteine carboxylmethyltransferase family protein [Jeotgalibacillus soli]KIL45366.1 hypothetical protein KP78_29100 [Jeotgalibacillus soli]
MFFISMMVIVCIQRLMELRIAKRNEQWMIKQGAYEAGASHYPFMVILHVSFFLSIITEVILFDRTLSPLWLPLFILFFLTQAARAWCLLSLGRFWNTKILVLPGVKVIRRGPYKYARHPNYIVVALEILILPLLFQAYYTMIFFSLLNLIMLSVRIPAEERALVDSTNYKQVFSKPK